MGISHSHFLGGPASWNEDDRDEALAFAAWQSAVCAGCGTHPSEWEWDRLAFVAWSDTCLGCESLDQLRQGDDSKRKCVRYFLRRAWTITRAELNRIDG